MTRILLIATGGTIAMRKNPAGKVVPADHGADLLYNLPEKAKGVEWDVYDFSNVIALNEEIHAARDVRKLHTSHVEAFESGEIGALGHIDNGEVIWRRRPEPTVLLGLPDRLATVPVCKAFTGMTAGFLRSIAGQQIKGLVIEAFGRGNVPPEIVPVVRELVDRGVPVAVTSRCPFGRTAPVYGYPGGGADLERAGAWFTGDLASEKVRLFMSIALAQHLPFSEIRRHLANGVVQQ